MIGGGPLLGAGLPEAEEERPEEGNPKAPRNFAVLSSSGVVDPSYPLGLFGFGLSAEDSCEVIVITEADNKLVVAVRLIPPRSLIKPALVSVAAVPRGDRETGEDMGFSLKVWVGILDPRFEGEISFEEDEEPGKKFGGEAEDVLPLGQALVDVSNEHYAFLTAESGVPDQEEEEAVPAAVATEERFQVLEAGLQSNPGEPATAVEETESDVQGAHFQGESKGYHEEVSESSGWECSSVSSHCWRSYEPSSSDGKHLARASKEVGRYAQKGSAEGCHPFGRRGGVSRRGDRGGRAGGGSCRPRRRFRRCWYGRSYQPVDKDCRALDRAEEERSTRAIAGRRRWFSKQFKDHWPAWIQEELSCATSSSETTSRNPRYIFQMLEANMQADFLSRPVAPGETTPSGCTVRGWLASKSRVQLYTNHVRWMWQVSGIWDALIGGRVEEARARCGLLVGGGEQSSIDGEIG